jgi:hypothetical protein
MKFTDILLIGGALLVLPKVVEGSPSLVTSETPSITPSEPSHPGQEGSFRYTLPTDWASARQQRFALSAWREREYKKIGVQGFNQAIARVQELAAGHIRSGLFAGAAPYREQEALLRAELTRRITPISTEYHTERAFLNQLVSSYR